MGGEGSEVSTRQVHGQQHSDITVHTSLSPFPLIKINWGAIEGEDSTTGEKFLTSPSLMLSWCWVFKTSNGWVNIAAIVPRE